MGVIVVTDISLSMLVIYSSNEAETLNLTTGRTPGNVFSSMTPLQCISAGIFIAPPIDYRQMHDEQPFFAFKQILDSMV